MTMYKQDLSFRCATCKRILKGMTAKKDRRDVLAIGYTKIMLEPCSVCLNEAIAKAAAAGYKEGLADGERGGRT